MSYLPIARTLPQYDQTNWYIKAYTQGTTTPISIATDQTGGTTYAKVPLDSLGFPVTNLVGGSYFIPHIDRAYDLWLFPTAADADANDTTGAIQLADNITGDASSTYTSLATLKASTSTSGTAYVTGKVTAGDGYEGRFVWVSGDQSARVTADTMDYVWVAPDYDSTGASGAWKRDEGTAITLAGLKLFAGVGGTVNVMGRTTVGDGYEGTFDWIAGDKTTEVDADTFSAIWVESSVTGYDKTVGAYLRRFSQWHPIDPRWFVSNTTPGTTDMTSALNAAYLTGKRVLYPEEKMRVTGTVTVPADAVSIGAGFTSNYANPVRDGGSQVVVDVSTTDNVFELSGTALQGYGASFHGIRFTSHSNVASSDLSAQTINLFSLNNVFQVKFSQCVFEHLNVTNVIDTLNNCNVVSIDNCNAALIGDTTGALKTLTGGYTYGAFANLDNAPDSWVDTCFIEACGNYGVILASNSKIYNSFIDLNGYGVQLNGNNCKIEGGSIKLNQYRAVVTNANAKGWIISNVSIKYNNYQNATGTVDNTFAIRLNSGNTGWKIVNVDAVDEIIATHPSKTELQNFIHLGAASNSGEITNVSIGDTATSGERIYDPNGNIAAGLVRINELNISGTTKSSKGLVVPADSYINVDNSYVSGASGTVAVTGENDSCARGVVISKSSGTLYSCGKQSIGPKVITDSAPTTIVNKSGGANGGAVGISGFAFPVAFSHGGTGLENLNIVTLPDRASGRISVIYGNSGSDSFVLTGTLKWDGTTLTTDIVTHNSGFGVPSLVNNTGTLSVSVIKATTQSGSMLVDFSGLWVEV